MRLILIAPENVYEHEVDPSMEIQDLQALVEAETGMPPSETTISTDSGAKLTDAKKTLASHGLTGETATVFIEFKNAQPVASTSSGSQQPLSATGGMSFPGSSSDIEQMRLQALGNPSLMADIRNNDPELANAIQAGLKPFMDVFVKKQNQAAELKQRQTDLLNADPYDIEAQKKIEEAIRMEAVLENMHHAMEYSPEAFGRVTMLYINLELNGHPVKAFVDSGAQSTIISPSLAEQCGIMRLLDVRFAGVAMGVGTAKILGRIHSAQIKLGNLFLPCSFSVLEGSGVDLLFGLDMLKSFQCVIDLSANVLRVQGQDIPFLAEHELPDKARIENEAGAAQEIGESSAQGLPVGVPTTSSAEKKPFPGSGMALGGGSSSATAGGGKEQPAGTPAILPTNSKVKEDDVQTLMGLGAERNQAIQLLEASGGNVDYAASMLFGGGAQWP